MKTWAWLWGGGKHPVTKDISIRALKEAAEFHQCEELQRRVWGMEDISVVPLHLLLTIQKNGGLVLGAFDDQGTMVGFVFGFLGMTDQGQVKHCSHMAGVLPGYQGRQIGYRLKLAQRAHVLAQGLALATWTYDPLEGSNASLNIGKLGQIETCLVPSLFWTSLPLTLSTTKWSGDASPATTDSPSPQFASMTASS